MKRAHAIRHQGFTLLEVMIVVAIIGLLILLAMPQFMKARERSQNTVFLANLRICGDQFQQYALEKQDFPPDTAAGLVPTGMNEYLPRRIEWTERTPIGGLWKWNRAPARGQQVLGCCYAALSVVAPSRTSVEMAALDGEIDDGNLDTGAFRRVGEAYAYILDRE